MFCLVLGTFRLSLGDDLWNSDELGNNTVSVSCVKSRDPGGLFTVETVSPGTQVDGKWKGFPKEEKSA